MSGAPGTPSRHDVARARLGAAAGRGVRVAVIDSGWDRTVADPRVLRGVSFVPGEPPDDDRDRIGHGTACAELVLRTAPEAQVVPVRVFGDRLETSPRTLAAALEWAVARRFPVVSVSMGTTLEEAVRPLYILCERASRAGTVVVAAGDNVLGWSYPAVFDNVIGVGADRFESLLHLRYRCHEALEVLAWGKEQSVLCLHGGRATRSGTSYAAPVVAGLVSRLRELDPGMSLDEVRRSLATVALP